MRTSKRPSHPPALESSVDEQLDVLLGRTRAMMPPARTHLPVGIEVLAVVVEVGGELMGFIGVGAVARGAKVTKRA
jgi:hypothetical protein